MWLLRINGHILFHLKIQQEGLSTCMHFKVGLVSFLLNVQYVYFVLELFILGYKKLSATLSLVVSMRFVHQVKRYCWRRETVGCLVQVKPGLKANESQFHTTLKHMSLVWHGT